MRTLVTIFLAAFLSYGGLCLPTAVYAQSDPEVHDPLEPVNRKIFWFNDKFDVHVFEPVARGYDDVTPKPVKTGISNFFLNLRYPVYLVSDILQFKFGQVAKHTGRFLVNSTVGVLGVMDVAEDWGLPDHKEDFGIALAYDGVPPGPYIVLPFIGPSNLRDTVGFVIDTALDPFYWLGSYTNLSTGAVTSIQYSETALHAVDVRAHLLDAVKTAKESSVDYYLFSQGAYYQYRRGLVYDGNPPDLEEENQSSNDESTKHGK